MSFQFQVSGCRVSNRVHRGLVRGSYSAAPQESGEPEESVLDFFAGSAENEQHAPRAGVRRSIEVGATNVVLSMEEDENIGQQMRMAAATLNFVRPLLELVVGIAGADLERRVDQIPLPPPPPRFCLSLKKDRACARFVGDSFNSPLLMAVGCCGPLQGQQGGSSEGSAVVSTKRRRRMPSCVPSLPAALVFLSALITLASPDHTSPSLQTPAHRTISSSEFFGQHGAASCGAAAGTALLGPGVIRLRGGGKESKSSKRKRETLTAGRDRAGSAIRPVASEPEERKKPRGAGGKKRGGVRVKARAAPKKPKKTKRGPPTRGKGGDDGQV